MPVRAAWVTAGRPLHGAVGATLMVAPANHQSYDVEPLAVLTFAVAGMTEAAGSMGGFPNVNVNEDL